MTPAADIERYLAGRPVQAQVPPPSDPTPPAPPPPLDSTSVRPPLPPEEYVEQDGAYDGGRGGPRTSVLVLLALLIAALIAGAWLALRSDLFESAPEQKQVPNLIGMTEEDARDAIGDAGLTVGNVDFEASETADESEVTDQDPKRDLYVDPGSSVDIVVSSGLPMVEVPFIVGATQDEARNRLRNAKLAPEFVSKESDLPQGQVLETSPAGGESLPQGSTVTVTISKGPKVVPNVVGLNRSDAIKQIVDAGFQYDIRGDDNSTEPRGTVTDQIPTEGTLAQGSTVTLFVSTYEPPPPPPTDTTTPLPTETPTLRVSSEDRPRSREPVGARSESHRRGPAGRRRPVR